MIGERPVPLAMISRHMHTLIRWRGKAGAALLVGMACAGMGAGGVAPLAAQEPGAQGAHAPAAITVEEAVAEALEANGSLRAARARARAAVAEADAAEAFLWPALAADAGWARTNDPVGVFGTKLRQGRFQQTDLALDALNAPAPVSDWTAGAGVEWRGLDPAAWAGREAAVRGADAAQWTLERTREATAFRARILYWEAVRADGRLDAALAAEEAARATEHLFRRRRDEGVLTDADLLQAEAEAARAGARVAGADQQMRDARERLAVFLGRDPTRAPAPADPALLPAPPTAAGAAGAPAPPAGAGGAGLPARSDLRARQAVVDASRARVRQARRAFLPTVAAFAGLSSHAPEAFDGREHHWSGGVQLSWPVFTGFARRARLDQARAGAEEAEATYEEALREARAEVEEARRAVGSAGEQVRATVAAVRAAEEAHRLVRRRFQEGLATPVDLLQAEARLAGLRGEAVDAAAAYRMALARLDFVTVDGNGEFEDFDGDRVR